MRSFLGRGPLPERVDVTIIGGGVSGVALARECAQAHKSVLLLERNDFGSGTTCRSGRIVQGGLHFLESGELSRLRESLRGREALLREQPHLVQPLEFALAIGPGGRYSNMEIRAALWLFGKLGGIACNATEEQKLSLRRAISNNQRWSLYSYPDAICEFPERLVADWLVEACANGALARNHAEVLAIRTSEGRVRGVLVRDQLSGKDSYVESEWVINAAGPWVDRVRDLTDVVAHRRLVSNVRGTFIMLRRWADAPKIGVHARLKDGRRITISPWNGMLQVGSTESLEVDDPSRAAPNRDEVSTLLSAVAAVFPRAQLSSADIVFSYTGVRPIAYQAANTPFPSVAGPAICRHVLHNHADEGAMGMLTVFGGGLSTAVSLARSTVKTMGLRQGQPQVRQVAIGDESGVENKLRQWSAAVNTVTGISRESAEAVARWHGRHAMCVVQTAMHNAAMRMPIVDGHPQLVAQAVEAVAYEHAVTLGDILLRRVPMALDEHWDEKCALQAGSRIGAALNWNERHIHEEVEAFEEERSRQLHRPRNFQPNNVAV